MFLDLALKAALALAMPAVAQPGEEGDDELAAAVDYSRSLTGAACFDFISNKLDPAAAELERLEGKLAILADARGKSGMIVPGNDLVIYGVVRDGPAYHAGVRGGDRVLRVGPAAPNSLAELAALFAAADGPIELEVERDGKTLSFRFSKGPARRISEEGERAFLAEFSVLRAKIAGLRRSLANKSAFDCETSKRTYIDEVGLALHRLEGALDHQNALSLVGVGD